MRIAIVEDQVMFRDSLIHLIESRGIGNTLAAFGSLKEAREHMEVFRGLDLLLLDIRLPDGNGLDFVEELSRAKIGLPVLFLSSSAEEYTLHRVSKSFAQGYVHKDDKPEILITAMQTVSAGGAYFSPSYQSLRNKSHSQKDSFDKLLSEREQSILELMGTGAKDTEIAAELGISSATVHTHRRNIMQKLDLHTAQELQTYAIKRGFTDPNKLVDLN